MHHLTGKEIKNKFLNNELTALEIVNYFLRRIDKHNEQIGAFVTIYHEQARERAQTLDEKKSRGEKMGKLAGIPIALKDNIHKKGEITTCSSKFLTNYRAPFDATVTQILEEEDAIILGKTNLDEFAMGSSTENSALMETRNPWNLERVPGGSSGGSAAAVSARLCPISLGSDTGGSIRQPAALTGILGFKPTYGRVSRFGLVAFGSSLDQVGPFATSPEDIALVMEVLGKHCERDSTSIPEGEEDYNSSLDQGVSGKKIGIPWQFLEGLSNDSKEVFNKSLDTFKKLGAEIVDIDLSILKYSIAVYYILATAEASTNLARFDGVRYGLRSENAKNLREVYDFSKEEGYGAEVKRRIMLGTYVLSAGYQDAYYKKAQKVRTLIIEKYKQAFEICDIVATPVTTSAAFKRGEIKDPMQMYLEDIYTISSNLAGLPAISVPGGFSYEGLPLGLQLIAPQKHDVEVISVAASYLKETTYHQSSPEEFAN
ncbi:MAG: Asp-tRNA(Asn)/Glu-tRNA(Gln) amidotransferase subunit GatA [Chlamydiota bacterium]